MVSHRYIGGLEGNEAHFLGGLNGNYRGTLFPPSLLRTSKYTSPLETLESGGSTKGGVPSRQTPM